MKLTFIGAAHEVTGSCHYLEACGKHILIDCGLEQGPDLYENQEIPSNPSMIDYILLTFPVETMALLTKDGDVLDKEYGHISRNPKQNGETGRHFVPVLRFTNHFILYRTP